MNAGSAAGPRITVVRGDITEQTADAIVNAANSSLLGGGGVDGAIHRKGGSAILDECVRLREDHLPDGLPPGAAVPTTAGGLPARRVIHAVGPVWRGGSHDEPRILASAYSACMRVARAEQLRTIAFPSISTGAYGYPISDAARVAIRTVSEELRAHPAEFDEVRFVLFSDADLATWQVALAELEAGRGS